MSELASLLGEIRSWKLEAKEEDNPRYFYPRPELSTLTSGENCYVIGRKGSGKTAIAEYIKGMSGYNVFVRMLSFKNFPFNDLYKLADQGYTSPSQYTTLWKYIIYSAICSMMADTYDIRRKFLAPHNIRPVVLLRDDIYDLIRDNDKNKWDDLSIALNWSEGMLQRLSAFRVSRAISENHEILKNDEAFTRVFERDTVRIRGHRGTNRRSVFRHMLQRTLMRPRDIISYLRECARFALDNDLRRVPSEGVKRAEVGYSKRFKQEFVDEIQSVLPYIDIIFDCLSSVRKPIFRFAELKTELDAELKNETDVLDSESICKILFHFSVIGNQPAQETSQVFRYQVPSSKLNFKERFCVHKGLWKSLGIT
jgi:hypothetical protein